MAFLKNMFLAFIDSFVNIFVSGRSEIKVALFFLYLLFLVIVYFIFKNKSFKKYSWKYCWIGLLLMYFYGFALQLFFTTSNNIGLFDYINVGNNGELSSSSLWHTHVAKASVGLIFSYFGKTQFQTLDSGSVYLEYIPHFILLGGAILLLCLIIAAIFYFATSFKLFLKDKNIRQKIVLIFGYAVASFSLIEGSVDGGILSRNFLISVLFIVALFIREKGKKLKYFYPAVVLVGIFLLLNHFFSQNLTYIDIYGFVSLLLLYGLILGASEKKINKLILVPLFVIFVISWWMSSLRIIQIYKYSSTYIPASSTIYTHNASLNKVEASINKNGQTIELLAKSLNKNISYAPVSVDGITCARNNSSIVIKAILVSKQSLNNVTLNNLSFVKIKKGNSIASFSHFKTPLTFYFDPCTPEIFSVINGVMIDNGFNDYILNYSASSNY
jgi:hypothetical protein